MKYVKAYNYAIRQIEKLKDQDARINNLFLLICALIWRFSLGGLYLEKTLKMINEFDFNKNFGEEDNDGKTC